MEIFAPALALRAFLLFLALWFTAMVAVNVYHKNYVTAGMIALPCALWALFYAASQVPVTL